MINDHISESMPISSFRVWKQTCLGHLVWDSEVIVYYGAVLKNAATKPLSGSSDFFHLTWFGVCFACWVWLC